MRRHLRAVTAGICFSLALALLSCAGPDPSGGRAPEDAPPVSATTRPPAAYESGPASRARVRTPQSGVTVLAGHDPRELTLEVSRALFASAPTVVVAPSDGHAAG
ncbi:MAG: hypothetical protein ACRDO8_03320, partial [Nocardioidaceae bacterium]